MRASFEISISIQLDALCDGLIYFVITSKSVHYPLEIKCFQRRPGVGLEGNHFVFSSPEGIPFVPGF